MEIAKERPPYVMFEARGIEDRNASIAAGHYVTKDVDFALITPIGSKDRVERVVSEWFAKLDDDLRSQRVDPAWVSAFKAAYAAWREDREMPVEGTAILTWPLLSSGQIKQLLDAHIRTVEDLAVANEETIAQLGMGGRALKQRAVDWLTSANNIGKTSEELSALKLANSELKSQNEALTKSVDELAKRVETLSNAKSSKT